jgi:hypothetical protein
MSDIRSLLDAGGFHQIPVGPVEDPAQPGTFIADLEQTYITSQSYTSGGPGSYTQRIAIDLRTTPSGSFGQEDGMFTDLLTYDPDTSYGAAYAPYLFELGTSTPNSSPNVSDEFNFITDQPGTLRLTFIFAKTMAPSMQQFFMGRVVHTALTYSLSDHAMQYDWLPDRVTITFPVRPPMTNAKIMLGRDYGDANRVLLDAIQWTL